MKVKHLDHLNVSVANLADTIGWYGRVFGFEKVEEGTYKGRPWAIIRGGEAMLCVYEHPELEHVDGSELMARGLHGVSHFGLRIDNRVEWENTIESEGLELHYGGEVEWPHSSAWYVTDPTGYEIEVALWDEDRIAFGG